MYMSITAKASEYNSKIYSTSDITYNTVAKATNRLGYFYLTFS